MIAKETLLDEEWVDLVLEALDLGITEKEIQDFLFSQSRME
jgi:hypothetical protein